MQSKVHMTNANNMKSPQGAQKYPVNVNGGTQQKRPGAPTYGAVKSSGYGRPASAVVSEGSGGAA